MYQYQHVQLKEVFFLPGHNYIVIHCTSLEDSDQKLMDYYFIQWIIFTCYWEVLIGLLIDGLIDGMIDQFPSQVTEYRRLEVFHFNKTYLFSHSFGHGEIQQIWIEWIFPRMNCDFVSSHWLVNIRAVEFSDKIKVDVSFELPIKTCCSCLRCTFTCIFHIGGLSHMIIFVHICVLRDKFVGERIQRCDVKNIQIPGIIFV